MADGDAWYWVASVAMVCPGWTTTVCAGLSATAVTDDEFSTTALIWIAARFRSNGAAGTAVGRATRTTRIAATASTHKCRTNRWTCVAIASSPRHRSDTGRYPGCRPSSRDGRG